MRTVAYVRPTKRQRELLAAYIEEPTSAAAARRVGMTPGGFAVAIYRAARRARLTTAQMVYFGVRDGWLAVDQERISTLRT